jgi:hypothetical protein
MNYGDAWEDAWAAHVANWNPPQGANLYVYPEEMDETEALRTVKEQEAKPYPKNLITMCSTPDWSRKDSMAIDWYSPEWEWAEAMAYCHILERNRAEDGDYEYTVSITFFKDNNEPFTAEEFEFDETVPLGELFVSSLHGTQRCQWKPGLTFTLHSTFCIYRLTERCPATPSVGQRFRISTMSTCRMCSGTRLSFPQNSSLMRGRLSRKAYLLFFAARNERNRYQLGRTGMGMGRGNGILPRTLERSRAEDGDYEWNR